jgi:DNA-binding NarL/FixJ family response regulator
MEDQKLYILEDNIISATALKRFLNLKFGENLKITTFIDGASLLAEVDANTAIVIIDYDLKGEQSDSLLLAIKNINPKTEVIILSNNEDIGLAIEIFRKGANSIVMKGQHTNRILASRIYKIITYPAELLVSTLGINKMLALFILCVVYIGIVVYVGMVILNR